MSFSNPFAQFGDYRGNQVVSEELVTTNYLTGLPDPREITNEQASLLFKQLLKRHSRTKQRALTDLNEWCNATPASDIEDAVHRAYVQLYAKLSIDVSPEVRSEAHRVLESLYRTLGKKSSKYLKYSVGPWVAATFDADVRARAAAKTALDAIFPADKQPVLFSKLMSSFLDFIYDSCMNATALTLSDERYVTKEEATQKYTRLVNGCLEILINHPDFFDLEHEQIHELVETGRLWKFFSSSDSALARVALKLAQAHLSELADFAAIIWKELLRAARKNASSGGVALDIIQLMNIFTKQFPSETWPQNDESKRTDAMASIAQFVQSDPPHPSRFWPLLYNLVLMIKEPPARDLTPLYKPLEKTVMKIKNNHELEESSWGCFVSLASKMGDPSYVLKVFKAAESRARRGQVSQSAIAKFLARVADNEGVRPLVVKQLQSGAPIEYVDILARTRKFQREIEQYGINADTPVEEIAVLVRADDELELPENLHVSDSPEWLTVALCSKKVDAQLIVESMLACGFQFEVLQNAQTLGNSRGVSVQLDEFVMENLHNTEVCKAAVEAEGTPFVSENTAAQALTTIVQLGLEDETLLRDSLRFIKQNQEITRKLANEDTELLANLESLAVEDTHGIADILTNLKVSGRSGGSSAKGSATAGNTGLMDDATNVIELDSIDLNTLDLGVPEEASINILSAPIPTVKQTGSISSVLDLLNKLPQHLNDADLSSASVAANVAVLKAYFDSWVLVAAPEYIGTLKDWMVLCNLKADPTEVAKILWEMLDSDNYGLAYHAAIAFRQTVAGDMLATENTTSTTAAFNSFDRSFYTKGSLKGAVQASLGLVKNTPQYTSIQTAFMRDAMANRLKHNEYMYVDREFIPESFSVEIREDEENAVARILTFGPHVSNLNELTFQSSDRLVEFASLCATDDPPSALGELLEYAINVPEENGLDRLTTFKCLQLVNWYPGGDIDLNDSVLESIEQLLHGSDLSTGGFIEKPWIALQLVRKSFEYYGEPDASFESIVSLSGNELSASAELVSWLLVLNYLPNYELSDKATKGMLDYASKHIRQLSSLKGAAKSSDDVYELIALPDVPPHNFDGIAAHILSRLSVRDPGAVRTWYRDLRERTFVKQLDSVLANVVIPNIMKQLKKEIESAEFETNIEVSVNEKLREVRARRELEDDVAVEVIFTLPEQYPGKPATVDIKNLSSVSEAKKRHWLLEARQTMQNGGVFAALTTLLSRIGNYLEGVEPCAICYMMVNETNKLPNKTCAQCNNVYHTDCLYHWFSSNGSKLCPMCRNPM